MDNFARDWADIHHNMHIEPLSHDISVLLDHDEFMLFLAEGDPRWHQDLKHKTYF